MSLRSISFLLVAMCVCAPSLARAEDPKGAAADELFERGKELLRAGNWPDACAKFQASMDLDPAVGTRLKLAKCDEHDGKLMRALRDYREALKLNQEKTSQTEARRAELEAFTESAIAELEPRVPKLRVVIPLRPPGLRVMVAGKDLPLAALGEDLPADPGPIEIVAEAPAYETVIRPLVLRESSTTEIVVALPPIASPVAPPSASTPAPSGSARRTVGFVVGGAGVVGLGIAGWLGLRTMSKVNESTAPGGGCNATYQCSEQGAALIADARAAQTGAIVSLALGALGLGAGIYLIATQSPAGASPRAQAPPSASLELGVLPAGAFVGGRF